MCVCEDKVSGLQIAGIIGVSLRTICRTMGQFGLLVMNKYI